MRTRRSPRNQERLYQSIGRQLQHAAARKLGAHPRDLPPAPGEDRVCPDGPTCPDKACRGHRLAQGLPVDPPVPLYTAMLMAGVELGHHESDLYVEASPLARAILKRYPGTSPEGFRNQITGTAWIDIPFNYLPWWARVHHRGERAEGRG